MPETLLPDKGTKDMPSVEEIDIIADELDAQMRTRSKTPAKATKVYKTHFRPFMSPTMPPFQVKYAPTARSNIIEAAKVRLHDEYMQVKDPRSPFKVGELAEHYQVGVTLPGHC